MPTEHRRPKHTKNRKLPDLPPRKHHSQNAAPSQSNQLRSFLPPPKPKRSFASSIQSENDVVDHNRRRVSMTDISYLQNDEINDVPHIHETHSLPNSPDQKRKLNMVKHGNDSNNGTSKDEKVAASCGEVPSPRTRHKLYSIKSLRCHSCTRPINPHERVSVQDHVFHPVCFVCSICHVTLTPQGYCYIPLHNKFYCIFHYNDVSGANSGLSDSEGEVQGVGPGVESFKKESGEKTPKIVVQVVSDKEDRMAQATALAKELHQLRSRKRRLEKKEEKLMKEIKETEASKEPKEEDIKRLWQLWFNNMDEKNSVTRREIELAYQLKDMEMNAQHDKLERQLRALTKKGENADCEEEAVKEKELLEQILCLVEKRDILVTELNTQRKSQTEAETILNMQKQEKGLLLAPDLIQSTSPEMEKLPSKVKTQAKFACLQCVLF